MQSRSGAAALLAVALLLSMQALYPSALLGPADNPGHYIPYNHGSAGSDRAPFLSPLPLTPAYGHGLGTDHAHMVDAGGQKVSILFEMPQEFGGGGTEMITIMVIDHATQQRIDMDVTLLLGVSHGNQTIFREYFFAEDGILRLDVATSRSDYGTAPSIGGVQRDGAHQDAWSPPEGRDSVLVDGSAFGRAGLYTFDVAVYSAGGVEAAEPVPTHYADLSVIESASHPQADAEGGPVLFGTKSYFDQIESLEYDAEAGEVTIVMPFDWRETRMSHIPVVHVETHFPKDFLEFHYPTYRGHVNGVELFKSSVIADDYTLEGERIVHFVLLQDHIRFVKNEMKKSGEPFPDTMTFVLRPTELIEFPLVAYTLSEEFLVNLSWDPPEIRPGEETTFVFTIRDGSTGEPLRNSAYTFVIIQDGAEIARTSGEARIGGQFVKHTFGEGQTGPTTIRFEDIRGTGQDTEFGIQVVPEFGTVAAAVLAAGIAAALALAFRYNGRGATLGMGIQMR